MLILGLILILVGALVLYFLGPEPLVRFAGACLVVIGLVLVVLGLVDVSDVDLRT